MYIQTLVPHYGAGCQIMASRGMVETTVSECTLQIALL